ncbi:MAG: tetratricopeptide repeat protein [Chitinophagales bacterium]|jgi:tetratricopeptide (TPR) repeat protein|nr:tetratricopeptide repeat protein [Chitinophagales bacterium]
MKKFLTILFVLTALSATSFSQSDATLAQQFMSNGEYDKAADIYKKLYNENANSYYKSYYNCLLVLNDFKEIEKIIGKQIKNNPENLTYYVDLGYAYEKNGNTKERDKQWELAIQKITDNKTQVNLLANAFVGLDQLYNAIKTYEKAQKIVSTYSFNYELGGMYYRAGNLDLSVETYLDYYAENDKSAMSKTTAALSRILDEEKDHTLLQEKIFERIQKNQNEILFTELLIWDYIQLKDFDGAFIQAKALDKRNKENGERVFDLAETAKIEGAYDNAIEGYNYIIAKGKNFPYYFSSKNGILNCRKDKIFKTNSYSDVDISELKSSYTDFLQEYLKNDFRAATVTADLAKLEAFYIHDIDRAIEILEPVVEWPALNISDRSKIKLDLGDFYLISGDVWEATLLYSQVDKAMKDEPLGEEARLKNAKLAYYRGDFKYSQGMLDVLKAATSELVSNDAMKLSVFITENLALDSVSEPMELFAKADLMVFQNKIKEAVIILDTLDARYPAHKLADDILFLKSTIALRQKDITTAVAYLETIRENYTYELLADDAIFKLAEIYQYDFKDLEKAKLCYEQIILNFKDSLYANEARKRFRALRGDNLN